MPLTIPQKTLADLVGIAAKISTGKTTIAILECIKLRFGSGGLSVETTDMDNWITISTPDFNPKGCEVAIVPCKQFHSIVSGIDKDQSISLVATEKRLTMKTESSKYQFGLQPAGEWPDVKWNEKVKPISLKAHALLDVMQFIAPSCGRDDGRHYLQGIHISAPAKNRLRFAGCDGHQLSHALMPVTGECQVPEKGVIIPNELCGIYIELLNKADPDDDISLEVTEAKCRFEFTGEYQVSLKGKLVDGQFPDIDKLIPYNTEPEQSIFPREQVISAIRRIVPMTTTEKGGPLKLEFLGDSVKFTAKTGISEGEETVPIKGGKHKCTVTLGLSKILSIIQAFDGKTVTVMLNPAADNKDPVIFADTGEKITPESARFSIIMPMRG